MAAKHYSMTGTRRDFNVMLLAGVAAGLSATSSHGATDQNRRVGTADLYLNRLSFGATPATRAAFDKLGREAWLEDQLAMEATDDELEARLRATRLMIEYPAESDQNKHSWPARKEHLAFQYLDVSGEKLVPLVEWDKTGMAWEERIRPAREVQVAALIRAAHGGAQLREVMTLFWHNHFNVNAMRDEHTAAFFAVYDKMLRQHALGNFRAMLGAVTRSPAMLYYLNNDASRASPANENFARELFELHTLGAMHYLNDTTTSWRDVPQDAKGLAQGYIDQDVYEAARALTGWTVGDGRWISEGEFAPRSGAFFYCDRWHDPYQKRILGVEFPAHQGPMQDGEQLLDLLARHPATARYICTKLCRRLIADEPPEAVVAAAQAEWLAHVDAPDQIARVVRAIVNAPAFVETMPHKLKQPFEFLASFLRATGTEVTSPAIGYLWMLSEAGWIPHECRPPTGYPDHTEHWANTAVMVSYANLVLLAHEEWTGLGSADLNALVPAGISGLSDAYGALFAALTGQTVLPQDAQAVAQAIAGDAAATLPDKLEDRVWFYKGLVAAAALHPNFLYR
jgi:uncharacterized protein (DUF1800 family)